MNKTLINDKYKKYLLAVGKVFCITILLYVSVYPFVKAACYTLPNIDEFCNAINLQERIQNQGYLATIIGDIVNIYKTWQGTYTGTWIVSGMNVLYNWGYLGIRIFSVINIVFFVCSILFCFNKMSTYLWEMTSWFARWLLGTIFLIAFFGVRMHHEFFYFHTTSCMYTIPLSFALISIGLSFEIIRKDLMLKYKVILAIVFAVLGCGGSLQIPAFICFFYLCIVVYVYCYKKDKLKLALTLFVFSLGGALINTLAPGNFARQGQMTNGLDIYSVILAIKNSLALVNYELKIILEDTYSFYILLVVFFIFYSKLPIIRKVTVNPLVVLGLTVIGSAITNFPLTLAHGSTYMDNRNYSCLDFFILFGMFLFTLSCVNYLRDLKKIILEKKDYLIVYLGIVAIVLSYQGKYSFEEIPFYTCSLQLEREKIQLTAKEWINVFEFIENSQENVIELPYFNNYQDVLLTMKISEDKDNWVNKGLADYFDKEAIYISGEAESIFVE